MVSQCAKRQESAKLVQRFLAENYATVARFHAAKDAAGVRAHWHEALVVGEVKPRGGGCRLQSAPIFLFTAMSKQRLHASATIRFLLWSCGVLALVLGGIGIFLPGLPTTPFVLLAGACFVRASPRAHAWLLASRTFGPMLRKWEAERCLSRRVKRFALLTMTLTASASAWYFAGQPWIQVVIIAGASGGGMTLALIPSCD